MKKLDLTGLGNVATSNSVLIGEQRASFQMIPLECIRASTTNPRKHFEPVALAELAESIKQLGVAQPILVRPIAHDIIDQSAVRFEIVAGERRFRASRLASMPTVPAIVRDLSDSDALEIQVIENLQRADLHPLEEAEGYEALIKAHDFSAESLAAKVGKSKAYIYARLKLCALVPEARESFYAGRLTASTAILIARIPVKALQLKAVMEITEGWSGGVVMSTRSAQVHLERNYMLRLKNAIFKVKDDTLCPDAGACTTCPKRTGNDVELFADVDGADVCTDPICFAAKSTAQVIRLKEAASAKGQTVFSGAKAKKINPNFYGELTGGYIDLDKSFQHQDVLTTCRKVLGQNVPDGALLENPHAPGMIEIVKITAIEALLKEKGVVLDKNGRAKPDNSAAKAKEKAQEAVAAIEKEYRKRLFIAVGDAAPTDLDLKTLREVAYMLFGQCPTAQQPWLMNLYSWDKGISEWPERQTKIPAAIALLTDTRLHQLIRDLTLVSELSVSTYTAGDEKPQRLIDMALCVGVNAGKIRGEVNAEAKAKAAINFDAKKKPLVAKIKPKVAK